MFAQDETVLERKNQQEAILQSIRDSRARPLMMNIAGRITPITDAQKPPQVERADVSPMRKRESPMPAHRPAPAQPLRPAARGFEQQLKAAISGSRKTGLARD